MSESDLFVGIEPALLDFEGAPTVIGPATVVRAGHPILKGRESLFRPLTVTFEVEKPEPKAKAAEKAEPKRAEPEPKVEPEKRLHTR